MMIITGDDDDVDDDDDGEDGYDIMIPITMQFDDFVSFKIKCSSCVILLFS